MAKRLGGRNVEDDELAAKLEEIAQRLRENRLQYYDPLLSDAKAALMVRRHNDGLMIISRITLLLSTSDGLERHSEYVKRSVAKLEPLNIDRDSQALLALANEFRAELS